MVTLQYQHQILAGSTLGSPVQDVVTPDDEDIDYNNDGDFSDEGELVSQLTGNTWASGSTADKTIPDFTITNRDGKLVLTLNNQFVPKVRINKEFSNEYRFLSKEEYNRRKAEAERFMW